MSPEEQWKNYFRKLRRQVNLGWFLQSFEPLFLGCLIVLTAINVFVRTYRADLLSESPFLIEGALLGLLIFSLLYSYQKAHKKFFREEEIIVRYDEKYHYNCRLLKAYQGDQSWPEIPDRLPGNFILEWKRNSSFFLFGLLLVVALYWVPLKAEALPVKVQKPIAWTELEQRLEEMSEDDSLDKKQVDEFKKKLEELQKQDKKDWFSQSNLEASNSLLDTLNAAHDEHGDKMDEAAQMLQEMEALKDLMTEMDAGNLELSDEMRQKLQDKLKEMDADWQKNMSQMAAQLLKMRPELMEKLKKLKPGDYARSNGALDEKDLEECLKRLEKQGKCKKCGGKGCEKGEGEGEGQCENGGCSAGLALLNGGAGVSRGGGPGGEIFRDRESDKHNTEIELVQGEQSAMEGSTLLGTSKAEHELDKNKYKSGQLSDGTKHTGQGGEAVWKENLLPEEQKLLRSIKP